MADRHDLLSPTLLILNKDSLTFVDRRSKLEAIERHVQHDHRQRRIITAPRAAPRLDTAFDLCLPSASHLMPQLGLSRSNRSVDSPSIPSS